MRLAFKIICPKCGLMIELSPETFFPYKVWQPIKGGGDWFRLHGPCHFCGCDVKIDRTVHGIRNGEMIYA